MRARQASRRALALDPHEGHALAALANLHPMFRNWASKEKMILRALAAADLESPAPLMEHVHFLTSTGRTTEALAVVERASRINPLVPWIKRALNQPQVWAIRFWLDQHRRLKPDARSALPRRRSHRQHRRPD